MAATDQTSRISLREQEALVMSSDLSNSSKCECMMTLALQGNRPWDVFKIGASYGVAKGSGQVTDILLGCAANLTDVDDMLRAHSIAPPPPSFIPPFPSALTPFSEHRRGPRNHFKTPTSTRRKDTSEHFSCQQLLPETLQKLSDYFDSFTGTLTAEAATALADELGITQRQVRSYSKSRKMRVYRQEKKKKNGRKLKSRDDTDAD